MRCRGVLSCPGFTLVELLVCIAVMTLLIAVLIPAVQRVRESACRAQCVNNLKHIGLAFQMHHDVIKALPQGGWNPRGTCAADVLDRRQWGWSFQILPFLEQSDLYHTASIARIRAAVVSDYYCPSRRPARVFRHHNVIDYAGCAGSSVNGLDGVVVRGYLALLRMDDITDGAANTIMVGERQCNLARFGSNDDDASSPFLSGWNGDFGHYRRTWQIGGVWQTPQPDYRSAARTASQRFGSSHPAGINVVLADGAVRTIRFAIDPICFMRACVRNDGQAVNLNDL